MKLYSFPYSCYARKAQMVLDLLGARYEVVDVPYGDRTELALLTGGYIQVPVLVDDAGEVTADSRSICKRLLDGPRGAELVPPPWQGPIWAYSDWCDGPLEDVCFRLATPGLRELFERPADRALYTFIKERKFGRGCVEEWKRSEEALLARTGEMLAPTIETLRRQSFLFGASPTLADASLYGLCFMLRAASPRFLGSLAETVKSWMEKLEKVAHRRRAV
ncbi:MAG: glutathione S-transferase family protein [Deltaproteobacteria bacterium]|nr:glutathione S-transferase family protein [Deltaproteobacteria bacterium]